MDLLATLIVYQHANCLEYNAITLYKIHKQEIIYSDAKQLHPTSSASPRTWVITQIFPSYLGITYTQYFTCYIKATKNFKFKKVIGIDNNYKSKKTSQEYHTMVVMKDLQVLKLIPTFGLTAKVST